MASLLHLQKYQEAMAMKDTANELLRQKQPRQAIQRYFESLSASVVALDDLVSVVFVKISQAYLDLELPECAFIYAKATTSFPAIRKGEQGTPRNAEIVLAKAADALGHPDVGVFVLAYVQKGNASSPEVDGLASSLKRKAKAAGLSMEPVWEGDVQIGTRGKVELCKLGLSNMCSSTLPVTEGSMFGGKNGFPYCQQAHSNALCVCVEGDMLHKKGDLQGAINKWLQVIPMFDLPAAILNNISVTVLRMPYAETSDDRHVNVDEILRVLGLTSSVLAFRPHDPTVFWSCAKLAERLGWAQHARECVKKGLILDGTHEKLLKFKRELCLSEK